MTLKVLQVGAGGFGERWCREFLPNNVRDGTVEVVGLADKDPKALRTGQALLGLPASACFTDLAEAFQKTKADFCTVVIPPAFHETVVDLAIAHNLHILSEKPIADSMEGSARIVCKVKAAGLKMAVTMSHRFDQDERTLADIVGSGHLGTLNLLSCRLSADFRVWDNWRRFRHEMDDPLLVEGAVHQLDVLASMAGAPCTSVYSTTWRPAWAEYKGDTDGVVVMTFENGVRAVFEGSVSSPVGVSDWYFERIRADGSDAIAILNHREVELFARLENRVRQMGRSGQGQKTPLISGTKWINNLLIEKFVRWLEGGPQMETHAEANLHSLAIMFAAVESSRRGEAIQMKDYLGRFDLP